MSVTDLYSTRDRRGLLVAIDHDRVRTSLSGHLMWRPGGYGQNRHVKTRVAELVAAGWVRMTGDRDRPCELTDAGRAAKDFRPGGVTRPADSDGAV